MIIAKLIYKKLSYYMPFIIIMFVVNFSFAVLECSLFSKLGARHTSFISDITSYNFIQGSWFSMTICAFVVSLGVTIKSETKYVLSLGGTKTTNMLANMCVGVIWSIIFAFIIVLADLSSRLIFFNGKASLNILTGIINRAQILTLMRHFFVYIFLFNAVYYFMMTTKALYKIHPIVSLTSAVPLGCFVAGFFALRSMEGHEALRNFLISYKGALVVFSILLLLYASAYMLLEQMRSVER